MENTMKYLKIATAKLKCMVLGHTWCDKTFNGKHYQFIYNQCSRCDKGQR